MAIHRLTRSRYYSRADEITEAAASMIPSSVSSSFARTRITKFGFKAYTYLRFERHVIVCKYIHFEAGTLLLSSVMLVKIEMFAAVI